MKGLMSSASSGKNQRIRVLIVDSREKDQGMMGRFLAAWNFEPVAAKNAKEAFAVANEQEVSIAIICSHSERSGVGIELVRQLRQNNPGLESILLGANDSPKFATEAFRAGVYDCLKSPTDFKQLSRDLNTLREEVQRRMERKVWDAAAATDVSLEGMVGISAPMQAVFSSIRRFAMEDSPVLITGLIGTGKELTARAVHALSGRASGPLVVYRCCGVTEALAETELFGGPVKSSHPRNQMAILPQIEGGVLESAYGGTLLLDEIGDLPVSIQVQLAKRLQESSAPSEGQASRSGSFRLVAATRLNLADQAGRGHFSRELYSLFSQSVIHLPSLGERREDIPLLCRHFQQKFNQEFGKATRAFFPAAERALLNYPWPGNVRELENVIGRACLLADQDWIELSDLSIAAPLSASTWPERHLNWITEERWNPKGYEPKPGDGNIRKSSQVGARPGAGK